MWTREITTQTTDKKFLVWILFVLINANYMLIILHHYFFISIRKKMRYNVLALGWFKLVFYNGTALRKRVFWDPWEVQNSLHRGCTALRTSFLGSKVFLKVFFSVLFPCYLNIHPLSLSAALL